MRKAFRRNWIPKILALMMATAVWVLIKQHLQSEGLWEEEHPDRARILSDEEERAAEEERLRAIKEGKN